MITSVLSKSERKLHGKASMEIERLSKLMDTLFPQILFFLETGFVASKKIIYLQMSELYSIVRGKAVKSVEFGLKWGVSRIDGFVYVKPTRAIERSGHRSILGFNLCKALRKLNDQQLRMA